VPWVYLFIAGLLEIAWAWGLKQSQGFSRPYVSALTVTGMIASFAFLGLALRAIPMGTAYAVWTGIGIVGTAILGMVFLKEPATVARIACIAMIVLGVLGLRLLEGRIPDSP
jgi:quaternary ammonium compound-resistance protein SugE